MSDQHKSFVELALAGRVLLDEIDDYVDQWHKQDGQSLHEYLGMKKKEYALWVTDPDTLPYIIKARHEDRSLTEVVNKNYREYSMAARTDDGSKIERLKAWLKRENKLD